MFLKDRKKKKVHLSCKVGARIPRFPPHLIDHIFHVENCSDEVVTLCCDLVYLPVNFKDFLS